VEAHEIEGGQIFENNEGDFHGFILLKLAPPDLVGPTGFELAPPVWVGPTGFGWTRRGAGFAVHPFWSHLWSNRGHAGIQPGTIMVG
jgi:hypothetical protein